MVDSSRCGHCGKPQDSPIHTKAWAAPELYHPYEPEPISGGASAHIADDVMEWAERRKAVGASVLEVGSMTDVRKMDGAELLDAVTRIYWIVEDGQERAKLIAEREAARQEAIRLIDLGRNVALFQPPADLCRHLARHMAGMIVPGSVAASEDKFHAYLAEELPRVMGAQLSAATQERDVALYLLSDIKEKLKAESAAQPDHGKLAEEIVFHFGVMGSPMNLESVKAAILRTALSAPAMPQVTLQEHTKHVQQFLNDLWAFSIDPLHEGMEGLKVAEVCAALLKAAKENRDSVYELQGLFRTACLWVWKGLDAPGQTLDSTMEAMRKEHELAQARPAPTGEPQPK